MTPNSIVAKETLMDRAVYHWMHDQKDACLWGLIGLDAPLSDDLIEKTLRLLIKIAPIVSSKQERSLWTGRWVYVEPGDVSSLITRKTASNKKELEAFVKEVINNPIDTDTPPVFRVTSIDSQDEHYLVLQVHHNVVDGEGTKKLFELFAEIYRAVERDPLWQPTHYPEMNRSWFQLTKHLKWYRMLLAPVVNFKEILGIIIFFMRQKKSGNVISGDFPGISESRFTEQPFFETLEIKNNELDQIKKKYTQYHAKINDFIMASLMTTVNSWNKSYGHQFSHVHSGYTANLRRWWGQPEGTFANMSVIRMVAARSEELNDVHQALKTIIPKFNKAKKEFGIKEIWDHVTLMMQPELVSRVLSFLIAKLTRKTHALTNIGIIPESAGDFGRVKALSYSLLAPPLPSPNVIFTASSFNNNLTIHCNCNKIHMTPETAKKFMARFKENFLEFLKNPHEKTVGDAAEVSYPSRVTLPSPQEGENPIESP